MHRLRSTASFLLLGATVAAQPNLIGFDVGMTDFTSRSGIPGASSGDILMRVDRTSLVGVGNNDAGRISGMTFVLQDQDLATQDPFSIVVYPNDGAGNPMLGAEMRSGPFVLGLGSGIGAFRVTIAFSSPLSLPPIDYHYGVGVGPTPTWASDGLSIHGGSYLQSPRVTNPSAPGITTVVDTTAGMIALANLKRLHRIDMRTDGAVLEAGADVDGSGPLFGLRGHWADRTLNDGIAFRIRDARSAGLPYAILGALGGPVAGFAIPGANGLAHLQPSLLFPIALGAGVLDAAGTITSVPFAAPLTLPAPFGVISAQAVVDPFGSPRLTNAAAIQDS